MSQLSLEDVPPKAVGGKPLVLSCRSCNSTAGHKIDRFLAADFQNREIAEGRRTARVTLIHRGATISADAKFGKKRIEIVGLPDASNPRDYRSLFDQMRTLSTEGTIGAEFSLRIRRPRNQRRSEVAWLRAGYLFAFAALGYRYVLQPVLARIRMQIAEPDADHARGLVGSGATHDVPEGLLRVDSPSDWNSILVRFQDMFVFLPTFGAQDEFYDRIPPLIKSSVSLTGRYKPLPRKAIYLSDAQ